MSTATPSPSASLAPVIAEQHRIERIAAGLRDGESAVINGTPVTVVSLEVADLLTRYRTAAAHYQALTACGDYEGCEYVQDEMRMCRCQLAKAGRLDLIEAA